MLYTYHSNRLERLAAELAHVIATPLAGVFQPETVIVQNGGMGRWLSLRLADELGICANIAFRLPAEFVWSAAREVVGDIPHTSPYEPEALTWRILSALLHPQVNHTFPELAHYLADGDGLKRYEFARQLARLFDQYLVYRPDWILAWEAGEDENWQARLWRWLHAATPGGGILHWVALQQHVFARLSAPQPRRLNVERVSLFAVSTLSPSYLQFMNAIARVTDVHLFILNPSAAYWADIRSRREIARTARENETAALYLDEGNSLLASLGKQGREYMDRIIETADQIERDCFEAAPEISLLDMIQSDVLQLRNRGATSPAVGGENNPSRTALASADRSIAVHNCHSPLREVEVLHDQLLALFDDRRDDIRPQDVLIMMPDIAVYAPFIEAVFGTTDGSVRIPYSIADRGLEADVPDMEAFFDLFALIDGRFDAAAVTALLDVPAIRRRLRFADDDVETIHRYVREAGIRWGVDAPSKAQFGVPATAQHTWRFGMDRLLLGYAMPGYNETLVEGILPYDHVEGGRALVLGRFHAFVRELIAWIEEARHPHPYAYWVRRLNQLIDTCFELNGDDEQHWEPLRDSIRCLAGHCRDVDFEYTLDHRVVAAFLRNEIQQRRRNTGFLRRGVTFCALVPMRGIPHAVIGLIGMNDGAFPRVLRPPSFDLMAAAPRRGDRSARDDDRYLFLEALLAARKHFYISYVGQSQRDNCRIPPSVVVSELLDYVEQGYQFNGNMDATTAAHLITVHPLQAFSLAYFTPERDARYFTYNTSLERASRLAGNTTSVEAPFFLDRLGAPDESRRRIDVKSFCAFYRNPAQFLLRQRLNLYLSESDGLIETREPFTLNWREARQVRETLLNSTDYDALDQVQQRLQAQGLLPHGAVGSVALQQEFEQVSGLRERLALLDPGAPQTPFAVDLHIGAFHLHGEIDHLYARGRVVIQLGKTLVPQLLQAWLGQLIGHCAAGAKANWPSYVLSTENSVMLRAAPDGADRLLELLEWYWQGLSTPLHFYPLTSYEYARRVDTDGVEIARREALKVWDGSAFSVGEGTNEYTAIALRGHDPFDAEFEKLALGVYQPLLAVQERI